MHGLKFESQSAIIYQIKTPGNLTVSTSPSNYKMRNITPTQIAKIVSIVDTIINYSNKDLVLASLLDYYFVTLTRINYEHEVKEIFTKAIKNYSLTELFTAFATKINAHYYLEFCDLLDIEYLDYRVIKMIFDGNYVDIILFIIDVRNELLLDYVVNHIDDNLLLKFIEIVVSNNYCDRAEVERVIDRLMGKDDETIIKGLKLYGRFDCISALVVTIVYSRYDVFVNLVEFYSPTGYDLYKLAQIIVRNGRVGFMKYCFKNLDIFEDEFVEYHGIGMIESALQEGQLKMAKYLVKSSCSITDNGYRLFNMVPFPLGFISWFVSKGHFKSSGINISTFIAALIRRCYVSSLVITDFLNPIEHIERYVNEEILAEAVSSGKFEYINYFKCRNVPVQLMADATINVVSMITDLVVFLRLIGNKEQVGIEFKLTETAIKNYVALGHDPALIVKLVNMIPNNCHALLDLALDRISKMYHEYTFNNEKTICNQLSTLYKETHDRLLKSTECPDVHNRNTKYLEFYVWTGKYEYVATQLLRGTPMNHSIYLNMYTLMDHSDIEHLNFVKLINIPNLVTQCIMNCYTYRQINIGLHLHLSNSGCIVLTNPLSEQLLLSNREIDQWFIEIYDYDDLKRYLSNRRIFSHRAFRRNIMKHYIDNSRFSDVTVVSTFNE